MSEKVLTANHLLSGEVVFLGEGELWSPHIQDAVIAQSTQEVDLLETVGQQSVKSQLVVEPYLIDVVRVHGFTEPLRFRERIRTAGPTTRTDLGKQSEAQIEEPA